jgi:L-ornithine N5-oxygenase
MTRREVELLAIGAGPSNLGLAVALEELAPDIAENSLIIERNTVIEWQHGLLLPWAKSQVSFLKDLVTLRNPRSRFSFLSFLHATDRFDDFVNMGSFTPYRLEISAYLDWVAKSLSQVSIELGRECVSVEPRRDASGTVTGWLTTLADGETIASRYLVIGTGRNANIPEVLAGLPEDQVIHSTRYKQGVEKLSKDIPYRIALIGSSQSSAEVFRALREDLPDSDVAWVMRSIGLTADMSTKFTNELYYPDYVDDFYDTPAEGREWLLKEMYKTNYSCVTPAMAEALYADQYQDRLFKRTDRRIMAMTDITGAREQDGEIVLELTDHRTGEATELHRDLIFLGTGFSWQMPRLIQSLADSIGLDEVQVTRRYRLRLDAPAEAACYLQGVNESTHGIGDALLSVLADRARDITMDILDHRAGLPPLDGSRNGEYAAAQRVG